MQPRHQPGGAAAETEVVQPMGMSRYASLAFEAPIDEQHFQLRRLAQPGRQTRVQEEHDEAVIAAVAAALQAEEVALGLGQPGGVGQRPKPMPADLSTGGKILQ